jgi:NDP-sugar pyrophosphorylase family protein
MKAIVLAAGRGTRLGRLTEDRPKALLDVAGRPLLAHVMSWLHNEGVTDVLVNLHYRPDDIPAAIGDGDAYGIRITYVHEPVTLGTAGTVRAARDWIGGEDVLVSYGDVLTDQPIAPILDRHRQLDADATLLVHRRPGSNSEITVDGSGRITSFKERSGSEPTVDHWVNSGVQVVSARLLGVIPDRIPADLPADVYEPLARRCMFAAVPLTGWRVAVDSAERLAQAADELARRRP